MSCFERVPFPMMSCCYLESTGKDAVDLSRWARGGRWSWSEVNKAAMRLPGIFRARFFDSLELGASCSSTTTTAASILCPCILSCRGIVWLLAVDPTHRTDPSHHLQRSLFLPGLPLFFSRATPGAQEESNQPCQVRPSGSYRVGLYTCIADVPLSSATRVPSSSSLSAFERTAYSRLLHLYFAQP